MHDWIKVPMRSRLFFFQVRGFPGGQVIVPVLIVLKYLSAFYPKDDNVVQNTGGLPEADKHRGELVLA